MSAEERIAELEATIAQLREQIAQQGVYIRDLEARLAKDRHNSSKPPSSDGLKRKTKSLRHKSGKKPGGQLGHRGETLHLVAIPDVRCPHRAQVSVGAFPAEAKSRVQYGSRVRALAVYLVEQQHLPLGRVQQLLADLLGMRLARGALVSWAQQAAQALEPVERQIKDALVRSPVLRDLKAQQKVSGCFRSAWGAEAYATIRGYLAAIWRPYASRARRSWLCSTPVFVGQPFYPASAWPGTTPMHTR